MNKNHYNILAKSTKGKEYIITDMIATKLSENDFNKIKEYNKDLFADFRFIPYKETDFSWWYKIDKYLTKKKLYKNVCFEIDYFGNITRW